MAETKPLKVTLGDVWGIQGCIKYDADVELPRHSGTKIPSGLLLREKVNSAILQFVDEPDLKEAELQVTLDECWLIDERLPLAYEGARALLVRVYRVLWEFDYGLPLDK